MSAAVLTAAVILAAGAVGLAVGFGFGVGWKAAQTEMISSMRRNPEKWTGVVETLRERRALRDELRGEV